MSTLPPGVKLFPDSATGYGVLLDGVNIGRVEKGRNGWGWLYNGTPYISYGTHFDTRRAALLELLSMALQKR